MTLIQQYKPNSMSFEYPKPIPALQDENAEQRQQKGDHNPHNPAQPITPQSAKRCTVTKKYDVQRNNNDKDSRKQDVQSDEEVEQEERDGADQRHGYGGRVKGGANTLSTQIFSTDTGRHRGSNDYTLIVSAMTAPTSFRLSVEAITPCASIPAKDS